MYIYIYIYTCIIIISIISSIIIIIISIISSIIRIISIVSCCCHSFVYVWSISLFVICCLSRGQAGLTVTHLTHPTHPSDVRRVQIDGVDLPPLRQSGLC